MQFLKELFKKLRRTDREAAENMRDYVADAREAIDMRKREIAVFRGKVAEVNQAKRSLERQLEEARAETAKWNLTLDRIKASDLSVEEKKTKGLPVLTARNNAETRADSLEKSIAQQEEALVKLRKQLMEAQTDLAEREQNLATLAARHQAVKIRKGLNQASEAFAMGKNSLGAVDELEAKVRSEEDRADALEEEAALSMPGSEAAAVAKEFDPKRAQLDAELESMFGTPSESKPA